MWYNIIIEIPFSPKDYPIVRWGFSDTEKDVKSYLLGDTHES